MQALRITNQLKHHGSAFEFRLGGTEFAFKKVCVGRQQVSQRTQNRPAGSDGI
jgi:hypothetical protein